MILNDHVVVCRKREEFDLIFILLCLYDSLLIPSRTSLTLTCINSSLQVSKEYQSYQQVLITLLRLEGAFTFGLFTTSALFAQRPKAPDNSSEDDQKKQVEECNRV